MYLALAIGSLATCAAIGGHVSAAKRRPTAEGLVLGYLLGPVGILVAALLPSRPVPRKPRRIPTVDRYREPDYSAEESAAADWVSGR